MKESIMVLPEYDIGVLLSYIQTILQISIWKVVKIILSELKIIEFVNVGLKSRLFFPEYQSIIN